jgi:hypothetical protein
MENINYVTFDEAGALTGAYLQAVHPGHENAYFPVTPEQRANWPAFRMNEARDGLEDAPVVQQEPQIPQTVTRRQARQALLLAGLLDQVAPAIAAIPDAMERGMAEIEWADSLEFVRTRPLVISIGTAIGLDSAGLDALFIQAGAL